MYFISFFCATKPSTFGRFPILTASSSVGSSINLKIPLNASSGFISILYFLANP
jgi:hypothetical protein